MRICLRKRGATAVEFALVAQMFIFLLISVFDIVGMMNAYSTLQWSLATAARSVMSNPTITTSATQTVAQNAANLAGFTSSTGTTFTVTSGTCGTTTCMTITGAYTYQFVLAKAFCATGNVGNGGLCSISLKDTVVAPIGSAS